MAALGVEAMKVHIIGLPSSGKTTLADALAERLGVPAHHLDPVAFVDDRWTPRPLEEREAIVAGFTQESSFITEGSFLGWTAPLFADADTIIWLDPPLQLMVWRHLRRHGLANPSWTAGLIRFQVLSYLRPRGSGPARDDPNQTRPGMAQELRPWADKVLRIRRAVSVDEVIAALNL